MLNLIHHWNPNVIVFDRNHCCVLMKILDWYVNLDLLLLVFDLAMNDLMLVY